NRVTAGERDPSGALVASGLDYRVLAPAVVMDANRNRRAVSHDALGMVVGTAVMGKPGESLGDSLDGFAAELTDSAIATHLADPLDNPRALLGRASTRLVYDLHAYARTAGLPEPQPAVVSTIARETHDADPGGATTKVQSQLSYSDGYGREIQRKQRAEPGPVEDGGSVVDPRWIGTGWTIADNKGNTVRKYEPFLSGTHRFTFGAAVGVSPIMCYDPLERLVAVIHPHHAWEKTVRDPWRQETWDVNDTAVISDPVSDPDVGDRLRRLPPAQYAPTWYGARAGGALGAAEQDAATKTAGHAGTPALAVADTLGKSVLIVAHNRTQPESGPPVEEFYRTRMTLDIEGRQWTVVDPKDRVAVRYTYDLLGNRIHLASMEAGECWDLPDTAGQPVRRWDSRGHEFTVDYDALRRPVRRTVRGTDSSRSDPRTLNVTIVYEKLEYGEGQPGDVVHNLRTRVIRTSDGAGVDATPEYDFKGNATQQTRQYTVDYKAVPDWSGSPALEPETWHNHATFDALARPVTLSTPDGSTAHFGFNEASLLETVDVHVRGAVTGTPFVRGIAYNARGQRTRIEYGNGAVTEYSYDPLTFRPARVTTTRPPVGDALAGQLFSDGTRVQDLSYTFDPTGNPTRIADEALRTIFYDNAQVVALSAYTYDAIYRLVAADGREHIGQSAFHTVTDGNHRDHPFAGATALTDLQAVRGYTERLEYDEVGNIVELAHRAGGAGWTRGFTYQEVSLLESAKMSNRLSQAGPEGYTYDAHGAVTSMPHLSTLDWDFKGRLRASSRQVAASPEMTYYAYTAGGERARKVTERQSGARRNERMYLRGAEIYREYAGDGTTVTLARETLHVMAAKQRVAVVETTTSQSADPLARYQLTNQLDSVALELDSFAALISYEEYAPYGGSVYQAGRSAAEVSLKRYRYTGRERDEETGFTYHGARYCAPWLGRWTSCDPGGVADGPNLYLYARANPCRLYDPTGMQGEEPPRVPNPLPEDSVPSGTVQTREPPATPEEKPDVGGGAAKEGAATGPEAK
ncbi:MAG TPA: RHS repeat-associated core domain-containing protein, partial [Micromonosporaceae bacterium]|nr:RHS repeat-associated core domain-containing protein [Micromonosporaceae bacterium]